MICRRSICAQHAISCGSHRNPRSHRGRGDLAGVDRNRGFCHRLRAHECLLRNRRHRARNIPVRIRHARDVGGPIDDGCVVDVRNGRDIDGSITDIDSIHVRRTDLIRRYVNFARPEREPCHIAAEAHAAADENHECGSVHRRHCDRPRHPAPASLDKYPTSVVKRCVAPRRIVDPGPAPRSDPSPVAIMVGCPTEADLSRVPDVSIVEIVAPLAVAVEIFVADHVARQILRRWREVITAIAIVAPAVEIVRIANINHVDVQGVGSGESSSLPFVDGKRLAVAGGLAFAQPNAYDRVVSVRARLDAIVSGPENRERLVGRVDLKVLVIRQPANVDADRSRRKLNLSCVVIQVQERETGVGRQTNHGRSQLHFGA